MEPSAPSARPRFGWEVIIVLGISLGRSAVYSILSIIDKLTVNTPLNQQTTSINSSVTPDRPWLDLAYQLTYIVFPLVPVALALYLMHLSGDRREIGLDRSRPWFDLSRGALVFAGIGIPGLALYLGARAVGLNTNVSPANLAEHWWTVPVLILLACMNGVVEEVVMLGFLFNRLRRIGWGPVAYLLVSAFIRASYHLYQGFGGFVGNLVMGIVFGLLYLHWRRVTPLVVAHTLLDVAAFVGYAALAPHVDWL
nr:CPBP family intramembrane glutamic endopeptidase [Propionicicella superfundia]